jgi:glycine betaine/choline ABC-type transport system substrate-binding protein
LTSLADLSAWLKKGGTFKLAASAEFIERSDALPALAFSKAGSASLRSINSAEAASLKVPPFFSQALRSASV